MAISFLSGQAFPIAGTRMRQWIQHGLMSLWWSGLRGNGRRTDDPVSGDGADRRDAGRAARHCFGRAARDEVAPLIEAMRTARSARRLVLLLDVLTTLCQDPDTVTLANIPRSR